MKYHYTVPEEKKIRLIINTDAKNEADDQFAIVHALLTPKFIVKNIIAAHFGTERTAFSMEESYNEVKKVLSVMGMEESVNVTKGAALALENESTPRVSEGAEFIIQEALAEDPLPLYIIFLGTLTDMASAYLMEPRIADRIHVIWIGGGAWPEGEGEFNLSMDIHAANVVFKSDIPLWQVPRNCYSKMRVSLAELEYKVRPCGKVGQYLCDQMIEFNNALRTSPGWPLGESWSLGDSPAVGLLLDQHEYCYEEKPAPVVSQDMKYIHGENTRTIRVYNQVDSRFILEDLYSKLALNY